MYLRDDRLVHVKELHTVFQLHQHPVDLRAVDKQSSNIRRIPVVVEIACVITSSSKLAPPRMTSRRTLNSSFFSHEIHHLYHVIHHVWYTFIVYSMKSSSFQCDTHLRVVVEIVPRVAKIIGHFQYNPSFFRGNSPSSLHFQ